MPETVSMPVHVAPGLQESDRTVVLAQRPAVMRFYGCCDGPLTRPVVLFFHGGTFTDGSLDEGASVARLLAASGALVVSVDYPLAPAEPFPAAVNAGYAALEWMQQQRARRHVHEVPWFLAGEEAGGNIAAAVATMARDRQPGRVRGQLLVAPLLDPCMGSASLREASIGVGGCPVACGWQQYLRQPADIAHPYAAPAAAVRLAGLPPALLVSFAGSPLQDDAHRYAQRLLQAGIAAEEAVVAVDPRRTTGPWDAALAAQVHQFLATHAAEGVTTR